VNTVYFWKTLDAGFAEVHRVLKPGGRAVVGFSKKKRWTPWHSRPTFSTRARLGMSSPL
jgi:ubiquinone/menaquinone biosynthesis C-methylase UbiE